MKVVCKLRQVCESNFVVSEIFLILHVVDVSVLSVLYWKMKNGIHHTVKAHHEDTIPDEFN